MDLGAVQAAPVMERAFAAGFVDESVKGDWEDIQVQLGLKERRERERKPTSFSKLTDSLRAGWLERIEAQEAMQEEEQEEDLTESRAIPWATHVASTKIGRNETCPCGSGKKYKKCCGR